MVTVPQVEMTLQEFGSLLEKSTGPGPLTRDDDDHDGEFVFDFGFAGSSSANTRIFFFERSLFFSKAIGFCMDSGMSVFCKCSGIVEPNKYFLLDLRICDETHQFSTCFWAQVKKKNRENPNPQEPEGHGKEKGKKTKEKQNMYTCIYTHIHVYIYIYIYIFTYINTYVHTFL